MFFSDCVPNIVRKCLVNPFDGEALSRIVQLGNANPKGIRSRLNHPNESDDGLTKQLGRAKNFRLDDNGTRVRADLHLFDVAMKEPVGGGRPLGEYVMDLASEDPGALSSSLELKPKRIRRFDENQKRLPDKWMPEEVLASDIVANGDAVHGDLLSVGALDVFLEGSTRRLPTKLDVAGAQYLDQMFPDADREVLEARLNAFRDRYLSLRFGDSDEPSFDENENKNEESTMDEQTKQALEQLSTDVNQRIEKLSALIASDIESRKAESTATQRSAEIVALAKQAGYPDPEQLIADEKLTVHDARAKVFDWKCSQSSSLGVGSDDLLGEKPDPVEKLREQWKTNEEYLKKQVGYTDREAWVRHECAEQGIEYRALAAV